MPNSAAFAFIVMTADDEQADGEMRAHQNVIHEAGLFQGRLGFERAIVLVEEGCSGFSNIDGLTVIRFPPGRIRSSFGDVQRTLKCARSSSNETASSLKPGELGLFPLLTKYWKNEGCIGAIGKSRS
jgi:predicted nucleotide-binding protein